MPTRADWPAGVDGSAGIDGIDGIAGMADWEVQRQLLLQRIESLRVIEQAKGVLMRHLGVDATVAFATLRRWSNQHNLKVRLISEVIVETVAAPTSPDGADGAAGGDELAAVLDRLDHGS